MLNILNINVKALVLKIMLDQYHFWKLIAEHFLNNILLYSILLIVPRTNLLLIFSHQKSIAWSFHTFYITLVCRILL